MTEQPFLQNQNGWQSGQFRFSAKLTELAQRSWFRYAIALFLIFIVAIFSLIVLNKVSPEKQSPDNSIADQQALERVQELETALKNDTMGGATPEETIQLFLEALKAGNMNLAAQYFAIDTNEKSVYYLTRQQWLDALNYKNKVEITALIAATKNAKRQSISTDTAVFNIPPSSRLTMQLNTYNNVWKIESL